MRVLLADAIAEPGPSLMREAGLEVVEEPEIGAGELAGAVARTGAEVLVVRSTRVGAEALSAGRLALVVRAGSGVNTIDVEAAKALGIEVRNCPGRNAAAVAELAFGLIIALDRHIPDSVVELRRGAWDKRRFSDARGLLGSTLGLLGTGHAGRAMIPIARAFGMDVVAWSRSLSPALASELGVGYRASPVEVARDADVVSVHVALTPETRGLVGREFLDAMKPGAYLVNTARAEVVDEDALIEAVLERRDCAWGWTCSRGSRRLGRGGLRVGCSTFPASLGRTTRAGRRRRRIGRLVRRRRGLWWGLRRRVGNYCLKRCPAKNPPSKPTAAVIRGIRNSSLLVAVKKMSKPTSRTAPTRKYANWNRRRDLSASCSRTRSLS